MFLPNSIYCSRNITANRRLTRIYDFMKFTEERKISNMLFLVNSEKAFDFVSCSSTCIKKSLSFYFYFVESIERLISIFHSEITLAGNR